jgi:PelA/Pel-15E family pectate lyase
MIRFSTHAMLVLLAVLPLVSHSQVKRKEAPLFDSSAFYDSAHHWYDIADDVRVITPLPNQPRYRTTEFTKIADNILLYQKANGGWPKNYDVRAVLTADQRQELLTSKDAINTTTFDNGVTHSHVEFLARVYTKTQNKAYGLACLKGIDYILSAQYANGGWPQFYPDTSGYRKYITFNDGAMIGVMKVLYDIALNLPAYGFVDAGRRERVRHAVARGIECILKCQIREADTLTAWCQQHDNRDFRPRNARAFEPASICNLESADIVLFLMRIDRPDRGIEAAIESAVQWFKKSQIHGIKLQTVGGPHAEYEYHSTDSDKVVVLDKSAPSLWPRFSELVTHRPLFCNRDARPVYSLAEVERERRTGYAWYTYAPAAVLKQYQAWVKRVRESSVE